MKSDANGQFALCVLPGFYVVTVQRRNLDSIGLADIERDVDVVNATTNVSVSVPSFATLWHGACVGRGMPRDSGFMYSTIRDASTRDNFTNTRVSVSWVDVGIGANNKLVEIRRTVDTVSDSLGTYATCGIPVDVPPEVRATIDSSITTSLQLGARQSRVQRQDISLVVLESSATGAAAGTRTGAVKGRITNTTGEPVGNVRVSVGGIVKARSDSLGNLEPLR